MSAEAFKGNLIRYYDQEATLRDSKSHKPDWKIAARQGFRDLIAGENKRTLLELGAGAGYDSLFFMEQGFAVTAVDISGEMVKLCRAKGIDARELDFYNLSSLGRTFDCVFAINTLLHVPKADLRQVLGGIHEALNADGLFYMGLYGGDDAETEWVKEDVSKAPRFFSFHSEEYLRGVLAEFFHILGFETISLGEEIDSFAFHSITLRKK